MYKNKSYHAFTLVEALLTVLILAIVSVLVLSIVSNAKPNKNIINAKKAFNTASKTIQILTNDSNIYIDGTFRNISIPISESNKTEYFCNKFADQLNLKTSVNCKSIATTNVPKGTPGKNIDDACGANYDWKGDNYTLISLSKEKSAFETIDGIGWYGLYGEFTDEDYKIVCIDVAPEDNAVPAFGIGVNKEGRIVPGEIIKHCLDEDVTEQDSSICPL